jgi:hypothetical protein
MPVMTLHVTEAFVNRCASCDYTTRIRESFAAHLEQHSPRQFHCDDNCNATFGGMISLRDHYRRVHGVWKSSGCNRVVHNLPYNRDVQL